MSTPSLVLKKIPGSYSEVDQHNPLRWVIFKREGDAFIQQTNQFRCKDFFNDFVAKYHGNDCIIYGMNTAKVEVDSYGMFIGLWNTTPQLVSNIEKALNPKLKEECGVELQPVKVGDVVLLLLPRVLFDSTYTISFVTLLIRACNDATEWDCYEHMVTESIENIFSGKEEWFKGASLLPPEHLRKYWFYCGDKAHSECVQQDHYAFSTYVHNSGVLTWRGAKGFSVTTEVVDSVAFA